MSVKKSLLAASVITTITAGSLLGVSAVSAQSADGQSSLIDKIVAKFNLNRDEVESVFEEQRDEMKAEAATDLSERLQERVDDGDITAEQKTLIEEKAQEIQAAREAEQDELEQWAEDNGIDMRYIVGGRHNSWQDDDRLDDALDDGDITEEQKTLIEQKLEELQDKRESTQDQLEQWAEDNGLELRDLMGFGGHGGGRGGPMF